MTTSEIASQVCAIQNLKAFSRKSGVPYRTLCRIKAEPEKPLSPTTKLAVEGALKKHKPALRVQP